MITLQKDFDIEGFLLINFINLSSKEKELVRKWRNHYEIRKWMYQDHIISSEEHSKFSEKLKEDNKNSYWLVKNKNRKYLGVIYLNRIDFVNKNAYLGIYSNPKIKGAGQMLMQCLKNLAFNIIKLHTLKLKVIENNGKAIRFYRKNGFKKEGQLKEFVYKDKKWQDVIIMGIINRR